MSVLHQIFHYVAIIVMTFALTYTWINLRANKGK